ncbi:pectate lyase A protein [Rutstroemia sp. NJR-2017a BVV2]|nr:pectate lyase A protein [Rutstroemia sp. NJR-2017a BVV2]
MDLHCRVSNYLYCTSSFYSKMIFPKIFITSAALGLVAEAAVLEARATNTNLQTTFPSSSGSSALAAASTIAASATFDGGMKKYDRSVSTCNDQAEGGDADAVFVLQAGATLSNVIIGPNNGEGVHCLGTCTLNNVWWTDVCEDAATFKQKSGTSYVNGGGARSASDKILQHNGGGTVAVKNFFADTFGKLYRSCGNCGTQYKRTSTFTNIHVTNGGVVAGVNTNYGDKVTITNSCIRDTDLCYKFTGNDDGDEPSKTGSGADGTYCVTSGITTSGC